jgi:hypothetical protein
MLVWPLGCGMYVNVKPSSGGAFLAAPERSVQVFLPMVVTQCQPDPGEGFFIIASGVVEVPEQIGIRRNPKLAFAQHAKAAECSDGIRVQVDQLTPEVVQDGYKEFAWRKAKPNHKIRFKSDNDDFIDHWKFKVSGGRKHPT